MADQEVWYVCEGCGCRVPQSGLQKIKKGRGAYFVYACFEHGTEVDHREAACLWEEDGHVCGEVFEQSRKGVISRYCPEHRKQNTLEVDRLRAKTKNEITDYIGLYDPDRWNCGHRWDCYDKYADYACLPCKNCPDYRLEHGNVELKPRGCTFENL